jgi:hypothetical protein
MSRDGGLSAAAADEVEALCAIYGADCDASGAASAGVLRLALPEHDASLRLLLPAAYPSAGAAPRVEATLRGRTSAEAAAASAALQSGLADAAAAAPAGEVFLFSYIEWAREYLAALAAAAPPPAEPQVAPAALDEALAALLAPRVRHGAPLSERRSTFVAHLCAVETVVQARALPALLISLDRRVATATHNVFAYRLLLPSAAPGRPPVLAADCDDDGESAAGGRLMHLLEVTGAVGVAVVVSRWFGGVHLGPDRFRLINEAARALLEAHGFMQRHTRK